MSGKPITPSGYRRYQDELYRLWHEDRPRVVQEVADAAAQGDRSENAEYIYGKRKLREIDRRMRYLSKCFDDWVVVDPKDMKSDHVRFGATVTVEDEAGGQRCYQIVGEDEVDAKRGHISMKSPVGKALMNKGVDDEVEVHRPKGDLSLMIIDIRYE